MKWQVSIRPAAKADLANARDWYERQRSGLGDEFLASVTKVFIRLEDDPERSPIYYRGFRRIITGRFPYKVFFRTNHNIVIVYRILHASRDHKSQLW